MPRISYQLYCSRNFPPTAKTLQMLGDAGYSEVEGFQRLLRYSVEHIGQCKVVMHPTWGPRMYPVTVFTEMNREEILQKLAGFEFEIVEF